MTVNSTANGLTNGTKTLHERRLQNDKAIPEAWKIDPSLLSGLKLPLETSKNNLIELDLPRKSGILTQRELAITESYSIDELLSGLAKGTLTSLEVTTAFVKRAAIAHQATNCLTEIFFYQAIDRARALDAQRAQGKAIGPLHGLPVSLKECFQVDGIPATLGLLAYSKHISTTNSALVELLTGLGAVFYCKTNIPQTMMAADSHNYIFGRTLNPWNTSLTAGGSSGGESALVAFRGSPLGVGTDLAGSVRIPSLCCGTYAFRPSADRIPYFGQQSCANGGLRTITPCAGPIANSMSALEIFMKAAINGRPARFDPFVLDLPWRQVAGTIKQKLRFGVVPEDPVFPIHPPVKNAVTEAVKLLEENGHEIVFLQPEECLVAKSALVAWALMDLDDKADRVVEAGGEAPIPARVRMREEMAKLDGSCIADVDSKPGLARLAGLTVKRSEIINAWRKLWQHHQLDAVIGPPAQNTAVEHDEYGIPPYTQLLNFLDYPACVIPFSQARSSSPPEIFETNANQNAPKYNPENLEGAPCSIQVFTQKMRDEECMEIAKIVDRCLH